MALKITDECVNCDICEPECPNDAIFQGESIYEINPDRCTECVGHFDEPQCRQVCPVDCIPLAFYESPEQLQKKYAILSAAKASRNPERSEGSPAVSTEPNREDPSLRSG